MNKTIYKENHTAMLALLDNGQIYIQGIGQSMTPKLNSGEICIVERVTEETELEKNDIVFCKARGHYYLHLISAIKGGTYQISNNHGHSNGFISRKNIYGKVIGKAQAK